MRSKRFVVAGVVALLLFAFPGSALAETDIVLENESTDSEVRTGDSSFTNNSNESSSSSAFDPPAPQQGVATTGAQTVGAVGAVAPVAPSTQSSTTSPTTGVGSTGQSASNPGVAGATPFFSVI